MKGVGGGWTDCRIQQRLRFQTVSFVGRNPLQFSHRDHPERYSRSERDTILVTRKVWQPHTIYNIERGDGRGGEYLGS